MGAGGTGASTERSHRRVERTPKRARALRQRLLLNGRAKGTEVKPEKAEGLGAV